MKNKTELFKKIRVNLINYISIISIVILVVIFTSINTNFISTINIRNLLTDISPVLMMSCGVSVVLLVGSIDLSLGSIVSFTVVLLTVLLQEIGYAAYLVVALFGIVAGFLNGIIYAKVRVPSFIVTLCFSNIWLSAAYLLSGGKPLSMPSSVWHLVEWGRARLDFLPLMFVVALLIMLTYYLFQSKTVTGKTLYAIGANENAARLAGLNVKMAKVWAFTLSGLGSALGGVFFAVKLKSGIPTLGEPFTLIAIAAAVLGGNSLMGGKGNMFMTLLGVSLVTVILNGLNVVAVDGFWQQIVFGILVLFAVYINADRSGRDAITK